MAGGGFMTKRLTAAPDRYYCTGPRLETGDSDCLVWTSDLQLCVLVTSMLSILITTDKTHAMAVQAYSWPTNIGLVKYLPYDHIRI